MSTTTVQVVINGNQVQGQIDEIAKILGIVSETLAPAVAPVVSNNVEEKALKFVEFFASELDSYISGGKLFVHELNRLRHNGNTYRAMIRVYHDLVNKGTEGWAKRRQLLLTASAIWRYTFKGSEKSKLRYQIEAVTECNDCGQFASAMVRRMKQEKLWV